MPNAFSFYLKSFLEAVESFDRDIYLFVDDAHVYIAICNGRMSFPSQLLLPYVLSLNEASQTFLIDLMFEVVYANQEVAVASL